MPVTSLNKEWRRLIQPYMGKGRRVPPFLFSPFFWGPTWELNSVFPQTLKSSCPPLFSSVHPLSHLPKFSGALLWKKSLTPFPWKCRLPMYEHRKSLKLPQLWFLKILSESALNRQLYARRSTYEIPVNHMYHDYPLQLHRLEYNISWNPTYKVSKPTNFLIVVST